MKNISPSNKNSLLRNDRASITGLIITAGLSFRMGKFKPLLQYKGKSFLHIIVNKLNSVCDEIVVVTGHNRDLIEAELNSLQNRSKIKTIFNENYREGMFTSLQTGLLHTSNSDWVLYHFIDQPTLPDLFYNDFVKQIDDAFDWIQPKYEEKSGHPILLGKNIISEVLKATGETNLRKISLQVSIKRKYWNNIYKEILEDYDNIEDYKKLVRQ